MHTTSKAQEEKQMSWQEVIDFVNTIPQEQRGKPATVETDYQVLKIVCPFVAEEDYILADHREGAEPVSNYDGEFTDEEIERLRVIDKGEVRLIVG